MYTILMDNNYIWCNRWYMYVCIYLYVFIYLFIWEWQYDIIYIQI